MKPKPFWALNHFTVPASSTVASRKAAAGRLPPDRPSAAARPGRRAAVDAEHFGDLRPLLPRRDPDLQGFARLHRGDAVAFEHAGMEEGVPRAVGQLDKPEPSFGLEPFDDGAHRRAGGRVEAGWGEARRAAEIHADAGRNHHRRNRGGGSDGNSCL